MSYQVGDETLFGVWGLNKKIYTDAEVSASSHLMAAVRAGALVKMEEESHPARPALKKNEEA